MEILNDIIKTNTVKTCKLEPTTYTIRLSWLLFDMEMY